jgi:hypothetical protein
MAAGKENILSGDLAGAVPLAGVEVGFVWSQGRLVLPDRTIEAGRIVGVGVPATGIDIDGLT